MQLSWGDWLPESWEGEGSQRQRAGGRERERRERAESGSEGTMDQRRRLTRRRQMLRRGLITDLSIALGELLPRPPSPIPIPRGAQPHADHHGPPPFAGLGFIGGNAFWYGYHMPRTNARDNYYKKLEEERAARQGA